MKSLYIPLTNRVRGSYFSTSIYDPIAKFEDHELEKLKTQGAITCNTNRGKEVIKMFTISLGS